MTETRPQRSTRRRRLHLATATVLAVALAALPAVGAGADPGSSAGAESAAPAVELIPVPYPDRAHLEPAVAEQLAEMEGVLRSLLEASTPDLPALHEAYGELAQLYHAYDLTEPAEVCYRNAYRLAPRDFRWPYLLAVLYQQSGRLAEAELFYGAALAIRPSDVNARIWLAAALQTQNRLAEAAALLREAVELDPTSTAAVAALGEIALAEKRYREAVELLEQVLAAAPAADRFHYPLGLAYRALGEIDKARAHLAQRGEVGVQPDDPLLAEVESRSRGERVYLLRGRLAFRAGRYDEAAAAFAQAVAARPDSVRARVNLGSAQAMRGDTEAALAAYRQALELDPASASAHFNLGALLAAQNDDAAARPHLEAALAANPDDPQAHLEMAGVERRAGRPEAAFDHYHRTVELEPLNEEARLGEAALLVGAGQYHKALARLEEGHQLMPDQGRLAHALARFLAASPLLELRDGPRALDLATRVVNSWPTLVHTQTVAMALAETGRCADAAAVQQQALAKAEELGDDPIAAELRETLPLYLAGPPCRYPAGDVTE